MNNEAALRRLCFHGERLQAETGVSQATVSYVLNNDPRQTIPEETRVKILEAAHKLGYQPYALARSLRLVQA
jgi:DNA-binding LacI/PurR family transcriptional regulator